MNKGLKELIVKLVEQTLVLRKIPRRVPVDFFYDALDFIEDGKDYEAPKGEGIYGVAFYLYEKYLVSIDSDNTKE